MRVLRPIELILFLFERASKIDLKTALTNRQNTLPIHFQKLASNPLNHPCHHFLIKFFNLSLDPVGQLIKIFGLPATLIDGPLDNGPQRLDQTALRDVGRVLRTSDMGHVVLSQTVEDRLCVVRRRQIRPEEDFVIAVVAGDERELSTSNAGVEIGITADGDLRPVQIRGGDPLWRDGQPNEEVRLAFLSLTKFLHWQVSMRGWTNRIGCLWVRCRSVKSISHRAK